MTTNESPRRKRNPGLLGGEETELNMTPMIDIVFQLIIFFLITLKFKTIDERLDANLPHGLGMDTVHVKPEEKPKVKLKVFRKNKADEATAYTLVKIDNTHQVRLPAGPWTGRHAEDAARHVAYEEAMAKVRGIVEAKKGHLDDDPDLYCEIVSPLPDGGAVPEGDVVRLVDSLVQAEIRDIRFEGAPMPGGVLGNR